MRVSKNTNPIKDYSAVNPAAEFTSTNEDCFGKEYDNTTVECRYCASNEACALMQIRNNKVKADALRPKYGDKLGNFLGDSRPELLTESTLRKLLKGGQVDINVLFEKLKELSKLEDDSVIIQFLKEQKKNGVIEQIKDRTTLTTYVKLL